MWLLGSRKIGRVVCGERCGSQEGGSVGMIENSAKAEDLFLLKERMKQWEAQGFVLRMAKQLFDGQYLQLAKCSLPMLRLFLF